MNMIKKSSLAALLSIFALSFAISMPTKAETNPFEVQSVVAMGDHDGGKAHKCGEGKDKAKGKCGEGKCGEGKAKAKGKCGEGKCGEGKAKTKKCGG